MIKLFIRNYVLFIAIVSAVVTSALWYSQATSQAQYDDNATVTVAGIYGYIQQALKNKPVKDWPVILKALQPKNGNQLIIITAKQLPKKIPNPKKLAQGKIVADYTHDSTPPFQPFGNFGILSAPYAYQRIGDTHYYLRYQLQPKQIYADKRQTAWFNKIIRHELDKAPVSQWPKITKRLSQFFDTPIKVVATASLSKFTQFALKHYQFMFRESDLGHVNLFYYPAKNPKMTLVIGPLKDTFITRNAFYLSIVIGLVVLFIIVMIWTLPFYRALGRLFGMAKSYGRGDFTYKCKVGRTLALYPLYQSLQKMGDRIANLLASHKALTGAISHEIKTPLARMRFATEMLADAPENERDQYISQINSDITELNDLVNELLTHSRLDRMDINLKTEALPVAQTIQSIYNDFAGRLTDKQWQFELSIDRDLTFDINLPIFKKALSNLLINAYYYGKSQIRLTVYLDTHLSISIEDDGPGIPMEDREKVFEPFYRLDSSRNQQSGGHGLGLAITQKAIAAHYGTIKIEASPLGGARFVIRVA